MSVALVSVVMIFKDAAAYLDEAAQSVLAQSWSSLELLLVDDGADDGSDEIARCIAARDDRARVLQHPGRVNRGMSAARALGIEQARGDVTAFLDADDRWDSTHLAHEVALLEAHPEAGMVCGRAWSWRSWQDPAERDELSPLAFAPGVVVPPPRLLAAVLRNGAVAPPTCSLLVRTRALQDSGGPVAAFTGMYEDQVLNSRLQITVPAVMSGATSAWYRRHDASATALAMRDGSYDPTAPNESRRRFLTWLAGLPELAPGRTDPDLRGLVDRALREQTAVEHERLPLRRAAVATAARVLPRRVVGKAHDLLRPRAVGQVRLGSLARIEPVSRQFGFDRGLPVDRWYIEGFLGRWAEDIRGRVLEVGDASYTTRFGGARVAQADVLNLRGDVPGTSFVADLADGAALPDEAFDCVVLTQTLHLVFDVHAAVRTLRRILRPGGVLLVTVPGISPVSTDEWAETWHWSFTRHSARRLFGGVFGEHCVDVEQHGNALSATAFLQGLATHELPRWKLDVIDLQFPVVVGVRAVRPASAL